LQLIAKCALLLEIRGVKGLAAEKLAGLIHLSIYLRLAPSGWFVNNFAVRFVANWRAASTMYSLIYRRYTRAP